MGQGEGGRAGSAQRAFPSAPAPSSSLHLQSLAPSIPEPPQQNSCLFVTPKRQRPQCPSVAGKAGAEGGCQETRVQRHEREEEVSTADAKVLSGRTAGPCQPTHYATSQMSLQFRRSVVSDSATPCTAAPQAPLSITTSRSLPKLMSLESVMPSNHLILCHPLLLPSIFSNISVFSNESVLRIRWPKYWSFSFSISPSNEHSGL